MPTHHQRRQQREAERDLVGDDLRRLAHRAVQRPLRVRGPARHDDADRRQRGHRQDEEEPEVEVGEEDAAGASGIDRERGEGRREAPRLRSERTASLSAERGIRSSLSRSFTPSAIDCAQPCQPPDVASGRSGTGCAPATLRSSQTANMHEHGDECRRGSPRRRAEHEARGPARSALRRDPPEQLVEPARARFVSESRAASGPSPRARCRRADDRDRVGDQRPGQSSSSTPSLLKRRPAHAQRTAGLAAVETT